MIDYREHEFSVGCDKCSNHRRFYPVYSFQEGLQELRAALWANKKSHDKYNGEEFWEQLCPVCRKKD